MESTANKTVITVEVNINAPIEKVWNYYTGPEHITKWNFASDDWHAPKAENDLRVDGRFVYRMEAKDGSFGFDLGGVYTDVKAHEHIAYKLEDDRKVDVTMDSDGSTTKLVQHFEAEQVNAVEMQKTGWQAILNNFKNYVENN